MADNSEVLQKLSEERRNLDKPEGKRRDNAVAKAAGKKLEGEQEKEQTSATTTSAAPEPPNAPIGGAPNPKAKTAK